MAAAGTARTQDDLRELRAKAERWKPGGLTSSELGRLSAALEAKLAALPGDSPVAVIMRSELDDVTAEQASRASAEAASREPER